MKWEYFDYILSSGDMHISIDFIQNHWQSNDSRISCGTQLAENANLQVKIAEIRDKNHKNAIKIRPRCTLSEKNQLPPESYHKSLTQARKYDYALDTSCWQLLTRVCTRIESEWTPGPEILAFMCNFPISGGSVRKAHELKTPISPKRLKIAQTTYRQKGSQRTGDPIKEFWDKRTTNKKVIEQRRNGVDENRTRKQPGAQGRRWAGGSRGPDPPSPDQGHLWESPRSDEFLWTGAG